MDSINSPSKDPKDFAAWYRALDPDARANYADRAGTSTNHLESHLVTGGKVPRPEKMEELAAATEGVFSLDELAAWFYRANLERKRRRISG